MSRIDARPRRPFRFALVTGASSGIGAAFAEELPAGTGLLLTARDHDRLSELAERLARPGREIVTVAADLTRDAGRTLVIEQAERHGIDLLVNNAGVGRFGRMLDHSADAEREVVELNVVATVVLIHALLPGMLVRAREAGERAGLILVASSTAFTPVPFLATYAASKAFGLSLGEALAEELRDEPIDLLTLCPGPTRSRFAARSGFGEQFPGAMSPRRVAREGLSALGRRTVHVLGLGGLALNPIAFGRYALTGGLGAALRRYVRP